MSTGGGIADGKRTGIWILQSARCGHRSIVLSGNGNAVSFAGSYIPVCMPGGDLLRRINGLCDHHVIRAIIRSDGNCGHVYGPAVRPVCGGIVMELANNSFMSDLTGCCCCCCCLITVATCGKGPTGLFVRVGLCA